MSIAMGSKGKSQISDAEIIQRAKQLGMVEADDNGKEDKNNLEATSEVETEKDVKEETLFHILIMYYFYYLHYKSTDFNLYEKIFYVNKH